MAKSHHTTAEITSAEIKQLGTALSTARNTLGAWQALHQEYVMPDAPENQHPAILRILDAEMTLRTLEQQLFQKQRNGKQRGEKEMAAQDIAKDKDKHQPNVAELRELGKAEPAWVQEASAHHRSHDLGEFSAERRAQMETARGIAEYRDYDNEYEQSWIAGNADLLRARDNGELGHAGRIPTSAIPSPKEHGERELIDDHEMGM